MMVMPMRMILALPLVTEMVSDANEHDDDDDDDGDSANAGAV